MEPPSKCRRVWLNNEGRPQSVLLDEGAIGDDLRRKTKPKMDDEELAYVRLVKKDGSDLDLFEKVPADIGVDQDTMLTVVVDEMSEAPAKKMIHFTATLKEWGNTFGARRAIFVSASEAGALGIKGSCILHRHVLGEIDSIDLDMWFCSEEACARFTALLSKHPKGTDIGGQLKRETALPPKGIEQIYSDHYEKDDASPLQAMTGYSTPAAATKATGLRDKLRLQRLDETEEKLFENMHIIPVPLLDDKRKLTCEWLFFSASPAFHRVFDGPDTAPHIQVRVVEEFQDDGAHQSFAVEVDMSKIGKKFIVLKPEGSLDLPLPACGYRTVVKVPEAQASYFKSAIKWRFDCVAAAWKRAADGHPVGISGDQPWWRLEPLPGDLQAAISDAKKAAGIVAAVEDVELIHAAPAVD